MNYTERLLEPENRELLREVVGQLPHKMVVDFYKLYFKKDPVRGVRILGVKLSKLTDARSEHVLAAFDRLIEHEKDYFSPLAKIWVELNNELLTQLEQGEPPKSDTPTTVLNLALKLVQPAIQPDFSARLIAQEQRLQELEQQLQLEQQRNAEQQAEQIKQKLEDAKLETEKRLERQKSQLEASYKQKEQQLLERQALALQKETSRHQGEIAKIRGEFAALEARLHAAQKTQGDTQAQLERERDKLRLEQAKHLEASKALREEQSESERLCQTLRTRVAELEKQLERMRQNETVRKDENIRQAQRKERTIGSAELKQALVIDYSHMAIEPARRLLVLLELYKAFLQQDNTNFALQNHSNHTEFSSAQDIRGILLLGLEQMLLDMVNLPLLSWLNAKTFHHETALKQLVSHLESSRLKVAV